MCGSIGSCLQFSVIPEHSELLKISIVRGKSHAKFKLLASSSGGSLILEISLGFHWNSALLLLLREPSHEFPPA